MKLKIFSILLISSFNTYNMDLKERFNKWQEKRVFKRDLEEKLSECEKVAQYEVLKSFKELRIKNCRESYDTALYRFELSQVNDKKEKIRKIESNFHKCNLLCRYKTCKSRVYYPSQDVCYAFYQLGKGIIKNEEKNKR